ncbi:flagellar basal body P-ring formation chaperone FlgA [Magnetospirillum sp. UT-4]|uniref:flagellar basal body P-ring formation chaperone FlgA n=1 Tax=Magnetospirillum sp. UT-4 TaxID=2681467 RepID=UPI00137FF212|nr:flagellar basal body P-ring formation chaperone FlgA [Magnetospirillum sp. UT-4]CAA7626899.1 Distal basal body ring component protein [Magnetospirillum sp. UT-4]
MKRLILAALFAIAGHAALAADLPPELKPQAVLDADVVRLGDLWDNLGPKAETVVAGAPQPGKRVTADARWLVAVAQAYGIDWQPASAYDRIVIERAGQVVDMRLIETELREALAMEGVRGNFDFDVANRGALNIMVPGNGPTTVAVRDLGWDPRTNRFAATIEVPAGSPAAVRQRVQGRVFPTVRMPVLARAMGRGEVIAEKDIQWVDMREEQARRDVITDARQMIGQEPRFQVRAGVPVRLNDLQRSVLVSRNSLVTVALKTPFMSLTTQARAVEDGGKGDVIRITNLQTKRTVEATVDGPGLVSVVPGGPRLLSN